MHRISSNLTILLKIFIPTVWVVFFTTILIVIFTVNSQTLPVLTSTSFRIGYVIFYVLFLTIIYFSIFQLKRVEFGEDSYIVTNYLKTYRLIYEDIEQVDITELGRLKLIKLKLKAKGSFGKTISFLASSKLYEIFMQSHPNVEEIFNSLILNEALNKSTP